MSRLVDMKRLLLTYEDDDFMFLSTKKFIRIYDEIGIDNEVKRYSKKNNLVRINGKSYFMKWSSCWNNLECYTEHIASTFIRECGYSAQETMMGIYGNSPVVLCKDFTEEHGVLKTFGQICLNKELWIYEYELEHLISCFKDIENCNVDACVTKLWEMCLFDILIKNIDRHCANGGFCCKNGENILSPLFDNAQSLFHDIEDDKNFMINTPRGMLTPDLQYFWFEDRHKNKCPSDVLDKFKEIDVISAMDRSTVGIKEDWRSFYRSVVYYRHKCLIKGEEFVWEGMK